MVITTNNLSWLYQDQMMAKIRLLFYAAETYLEGQSVESVCYHLFAWTHKNSYKGAPNTYAPHNKNEFVKK